MDDDTSDLGEDEAQFEHVLTLARSYREISFQEMESIDAAAGKIKSLTSCQFLLEAYIAATNIRNVCGDGDAYAAQQAEIIRTNLIVVLQQLAADPISSVIDILRAQSDGEEELFNKVDSLIVELQQALGGIRA